MRRDGLRRGGVRAEPGNPTTVTATSVPELTSGVALWAASRTLHNMNTGYCFILSIVY